MKPSYHDFADKVWEKFKILKREIASTTQHHWNKIVPGNMLPSGKHMPDVVLELRLKMFDVWKFAPTSRDSKLQYAHIEMTDKYVRMFPSIFLLLMHLTGTKIGVQLGLPLGGLWGRPLDAIAPLCSCQNAAAGHLRPIPVRWFHFQVWMNTFYALKLQMSKV